MPFPKERSPRLPQINLLRRAILETKAPCASSSSSSLSSFCQLRRRPRDRACSRHTANSGGRAGHLRRGGARCRRGLYRISPSLLDRPPHHRLPRPWPRIQTSAHRRDWPTSLAPPALRRKIRQGVPLTVKLAADTYTVVIQFGAIAAVALLYWKPTAVDGTRALRARSGGPQASGQCLDRFSACRRFRVPPSQTGLMPTSFPFLR